MKKREVVQQSVNIEIIEDNLHDVVNWLHSGIVLPLEAMNEWVKQGNYEKISKAFPTLIIQSHSILNEIKGIQANIIEDRKYKADNFPIALKQLTKIWLKRSGLQNDRIIKVYCPKKLQLPKLIKESLLAIANEAISNAIKYSGIINHLETKISANVTTKNKYLTLAVQDNGQGADKIVEGYGIKKIKRIISELNLSGVISTLEITTSIGNGFTLIVKIEL
jgi:two-component sensor histidine kinase